MHIPRIWTGAVLAGAALALTGACTVADGGADSSYSGLRPSSAPSPEMAGPAGVEPLAIRKADVAGQVVSVPSAGESVRAKDVRTDSACRPLGLALAGVTAGHPTSSTVRRATGPTAVTTVTLSSYEKNEDAEAVMTNVNQAADACSGGFTLAVKGKERHIPKVTRELAPSGTDQAIAFGMTTEQGGAEAPAKVVVIRKGSTVCVFSTTAADKGAASSRGAFEVPVEVIEAQLLRLG